jgi:hypothetical protein
MQSVRDARAAAAGLTFLACVGWAVVYAADRADSTVWGGMGLLLGGLATFFLSALALGLLHRYEHLRPATIVPRPGRLGRRRRLGRLDRARRGIRVGRSLRPRARAAPRVGCQRMNGTSIFVERLYAG